MSSKISLQINGEKYTASEDGSVLDACRENDIFIPTLCEIEEIDIPYGGCRLCLVEVENSNGTTVTTSCDMPVKDGMKVKTETEEVIEGRKVALELLLSEHTGDCVAPCSLECPASLDVQGYIAHIANGRPEEAVKLIKKKTPLAVSLGRACFAPCEDECRRELVEDPMAIRQLKEYAAEIDLEDPWVPEIKEETGKKIGIVGGGPAGLTAAYFLRLEGHSVKIYDQMEELGGMMRYGIPNYRLPNDLLRKEIEWILDLGISVERETKIGEDLTLEDIRSENDSVLMATGAWESWEIPIPGHELDGVMGGTDFLVGYSSGEKVDVGEKVVVIGCGGCAMDTARTAKRMGADVTVVYRRTEKQAPAPEDEIEEAKEEGINFSFLLSPEEIMGEEHVEGMKCAKMKLGEPDESGRPKPIKIEGETEYIDCDTVLMSIGEAPEVELLEEEGLDVENSVIKNHGKYRTNFEDVFAAGDASIGPSSIAECTGLGREAAFAINAYLNKELEGYEPPEDFRLPFGYIHRDEKTEEDFADEEEIERVRMSKRDPKTRIRHFKEIEHGFSDDEAMEEAERCLECGCLDRFDCKLRDYSDLYEARQDYFEGESIEREIDDSHPRIERNPNKCILCGSCVRTTEDIHGEGELQFVHRGFNTMVAPPFEDPLGDSDSQLIGDLADSCPTGALEEVVQDKKPGPFEENYEVEARCLSCGLACPAKIRINNGRPLDMIPLNKDSYGGHLCDRGKFNDIFDWDKRIDKIQVKKGGNWAEDGWASILELLREKRIDLLLGRSTTSEEANLLEKIAASSNGDIFTRFPHNEKSNVKINDLLSADTIYVDKGVYRINPILKTLVKEALDNGANKVRELDDLSDETGVALLNPESDNEFDRRIVASYEANGNGLSELGTSGGIGKGDVLLIWDRAPYLDELDLSSYDKVVGFSRTVDEEREELDALVPIRSWIEKEGNLVNVLDRKIEIHPTIPTNLKENTEILSSLLESL